MELNSTQEPFLPSSENDCALSNVTVLETLLRSPLQSGNWNRSDQSQNPDLSRDNTDELNSSICSEKLRMLAHSCEKNQQIADETYYKSSDLENPCGCETAANACVVSNKTIPNAIPGTSLQNCIRDKSDQSLNTRLSNYNLADEIFSNSSEKLYFCNMCNMSFESVSCLEMLNHSCEKPGQQITDKELHESGDLDNLIASQTEKERFQCSECQKIFPTKRGLKRHVIIHTGEKPYKCEVCDSTFYRKGHLTVHMRTHTGERPYQCHVCNIRFRQQNHLTTHMRRHTGEKPYMCVICKKCFRMNIDMKKHLRKHLGKKSYKCKICEKAFFGHSYFMIHVHKHSGEQL